MQVIVKRENCDQDGLVEEPVDDPSVLPVLPQLLDDPMVEPDISVVSDSESKW